MTSNPPYVGCRTAWWWWGSSSSRTTRYTCWGASWSTFQICVRTAEQSKWLAAPQRLPQGTGWWRGCIWNKKKKKRKYVFTFSSVLTDLHGCTPANKTVLQLQFVDVKTLMHGHSNSEKKNFYYPCEMRGLQTANTHCNKVNGTEAWCNHTR